MESLIELNHCSRNRIKKLLSKTPYVSLFHFGFDNNLIQNSQLQNMKVL